MNRRSILRLTGGGTASALAGYLGSISDRDDRSADGALEGPHRFAIETETEEPARRLPVALSYDLENAGIEPGSSARMSWTVRNTGDEPLTLESGAPWPFDVAFLLRADANESERVTMWTDAYEESDRLETVGRDVRSWKPGFVTDRLGSGGSVTEPYELAHDAPRLTAGTYDFWRVVRAERGETQDSARFEFTVGIEPA